MTQIAIVAALIRDPAGKVLLVRKRGTDAFMQPGGKREPGEEDVQALAREIREELGCELAVGSVRFLGVHEAPAAHEKGRIVNAALYEARIVGTPRVQAEIEELIWLDPARAGTIPLAALTRDAVLPLARGSAV